MLVELNAQLQKRGPLPDPHGAGRAGARGDAVARVRLVPRLGVAPGADRAPSRSRGAVRVRLSDPAEGRHRSARRAARHATRTSAICTPGLKSIFRARDGSASTSPPACCAARGISRLFAAPHYRSAAPISGAVEPAKTEFEFDMSVTRIHEAPRVTWPFSDEMWTKLDRAGRGGRSRSCRAGRAAHDGRRADLRLDRRSADRGMEYGGGRPDQARYVPTNWSGGCASVLRRMAFCITGRANGIPAKACRAGPSRSTGARTASRSGAIRISSRAKASTDEANTRRKPSD